MYIPPHQELAVSRGTKFGKAMRKNTERKSVLEKIGRATSVVLLLTTLAALTGCMGFSQSGGGSGQDTGNLVLASATLDFGNVTTNTTKTLTVTANNSGSKTVNVSSVSISTKYFAISSPSLPLSLAAGQSATFSISFTPNAATNFSATLSVASDASNGTQTLALLGAGTTTTQLQVNPTSEAFGSVTIGSSKSQVVTLNNATSSSISISQVTVGGTGFSVSGITTPVTLAASKTATFTVTFSPKASGSVTGTAIISSDANNSSISIPLSGTGAAVATGTLSANPTSLGFGNVNVGSTGSLSETITNTGGSSVSVTQVGVTGTGFSVGGITTPATLNAGQSATFTVKFAPGAAGSVSGNLTVTSTASNPSLTVPVSGTGVTSAVGQLSVSPGTLALGNVTVGSSGTANGTVTASGASVTVTGASTNNSVFTIGGFSLPHTIAAGQSASFTITFSPTVAGSAGATLTFTSNAVVDE
jgi:centrosomal CEP192-like protein/ASPM-SPD-2-Hydin domain-containing protein